MKISLIASVALSTVLMASAAHAQVVGDVGVDYQRSVAHTADLGDVKLDNWQVEGAARYDFGQFGASLDGQITDMSVDGGRVDDNVSYAFTGHLNTHVGGAIVGGFAGVDANNGFTLWGVGLEGQAKATANDTVYGQVGYGSSHDLGNPDLWAARAEWRHFFTDNVKLQGSAGYVNADTDFGHLNTWSLGLEGEYRFAGSPWSVRAGYDFSRTDKLDTNDNAFRIGARYTFGAGSLKARDDAGADMGALRELFSSPVLDLFRF